ncbi:hypothetical protein CKO28_01305 [Rhodovibrio sodomensis]|uniref:Uncharacterized protein n=1 Tax=Rhodovibrio sodomensis TaxID=1088 RepID=A0ABS1D9V6_9PROT|nr:hypothetical protein [Rhodovibrio sodomensis]MBK1666681.1 hypothetical protein [Rhodovibrio sodomensis]
MILAPLMIIFLVWLFYRFAIQASGFLAAIAGAIGQGRFRMARPPLRMRRECLIAELDSYRSFGEGWDGYDAARQGKVAFGVLTWPDASPPGFPEKWRWAEERFEAARAVDPVEPWPFQ